jgi:hypothetical protein
MAMDSAQTTVNFESNSGVMYKLGSIEAQLKAINEKLDKKEAAQDEEIAELQKDVMKLKEWRMLQLGAAGVISFIIGILTKVVPWQNLL